MSARRARLRAAVEAIVVAAVFAGSAGVAWRFLDGARARTFIDWELLPAAMMACGYGFAEPGARPPEVVEFVERRRETIACEELAGSTPPQPALKIARAHRYSIVAASVPLRLGGVRWSALDLHVALLFGLAMACVYGLFRQAAGPPLAALGVAALVCSNQLQALLMLRDFVKLPCFAALWLATAWLLGRGGTRATRALYMPAAAAGLLLGLALGFRVDMLVFLPVLLAVVIAGVPGFDRAALRAKAVAAGLLAAALAATAGPIVAAMAGGSNSAHVVVLGLMRQYDRVLGLDSPPYDIGDTYSDGYAYTVTAAHAGLVGGAPEMVGFDTAPYDRAGAAMLADLARHFPADVAARALGATAQIIRYPFYWRVRAEYEDIETLHGSPILRPMAEWRGRVLGLFEGGELALAAGVVVLVACHNWRAGVLLGLSIVYFCGYSMLQFSRRHTFHLDVVPIGLVVVALQAPLVAAAAVWRQWRSGQLVRLAVALVARRAAVGVGAVAVAALAVAGAVAGARVWQQGHVRDLAAATLRASWELVPVAPEPLADWILRDGAPIPTWADFYFADRDRWTGAVLLRVDPTPTWTLPSASGEALGVTYWLVELEDRCSSPRVALGMKYSGAEETYHLVFTRVFDVPVSPDGPSRVLTPTYAHTGSTWTRFDGFAVPAAHRPCVASVRRARDPARLPLPIAAMVLPPDWRARPLYARVQRRPTVTLTGIPVVPPREIWRVDGPRYTMAAPPLDAWTAADEVSVARGRGGFVVTGNAVPSGYQIVSPAIAVPPGSTVGVQVEGRVHAGRVCLGVLDGRQQRWLHPASGSESSLLVETRDSAQIFLVFANCGEPVAARFTVRSVAYEVLGVAR